MFFFLLIRRPPRSTQGRSSAASDVYKRQALADALHNLRATGEPFNIGIRKLDNELLEADAVSYTHLRAHETVLDFVCRLLLEKKKYTRPGYSRVKNTLYEDPKTFMLIGHALETINACLLYTYQSLRDS